MQVGFGLQLPDKIIQKQTPHIRVCFALTPVLLASIYAFGWRSLALTVVVIIFGFATEAIFTFRQGKPVTLAVFVTCLIFSLSSPPTLPMWMAVLGIIFGVGLGKMAFGGFGQNIFNPAMVGRCFLYITFPIQMTSQWVKPMWGGVAGFAHWSPPADALTGATPLAALRDGTVYPWVHLFVGNIPGSLGETSALLILLGGAYIVYKKAAQWRLAVAPLLGGIVLSSVLHVADLSNIPDPLSTVLAGSFLFGAFFVVTEPISGAKTNLGQWIYGFFIGGLTVILRGFSNFSEGIMFSVLIMNAFVPIMDQYIGQIQAKKKISK
jgi:Na+-transporting NADH:ubiquinone oxidoreductase subunit B